MLMLLLAMAVGALVFETWPSCYTPACREPFAWRLRRLDDGKRRVLCARCAKHVDRIRAARRRAA